MTTTLVPPMLPVTTTTPSASVLPATTSDGQVGAGGGQPATTVMVPITRNDVLADAIGPVEVTDPCPVSEPVEGSQLFAEATRLEPMLGQVLAYGGRHRDEFGTYGLVWHSGDDASVFVAFTDHVDAHRSALESTVTLPDELIVCQAALNEDRARALFATLSAALMPELAASVGLGAQGVAVTLLPGHEDVAEDLARRYGDAVTVTICPDETSCIGQLL